VIRLSELLGRPVSAGGERLGRVADLAVGPEHGHPAVTAVGIRGPGADWFAWGAPATASETGVDLGGRPAPTSHPAGPSRLLLRRHVLDCQVVDMAGKRLLRVADVLLAEREAELRLVGVEVGAAPLLRRLGLGRLARQGTRELIDWEQIHLASAPGHVLQCAMPRAGIHRLSEKEVQELLEALPAPRAIELAGAAGLEHRPPPAIPARKRRGTRFGKVLRARRHAPR
jgi:sporulation protein YlmC with PRC-barrel domain